ncbi:hypothetical protein AAHA92_32918 [Salvia divinorum]|uniref:Uncharacterized protein n=1 Tax=Salvia divinorum TaxID=28513 RepID=A0ABD1FMR4_SALDI
MQLLQWQTNGTKILRRCSVCCGHHFDGCGEISKEEKKTDDVLHFLSYSRNCSLLSTSSRMSQNFVPTFVYQHRRDHKNSVSFFEIESSAPAKASYACHSAICSEAPLLALKEYVVSASEHEKGVGFPVVHPVENNKVATASSNWFRAGEEADFEDGLTTGVDRILNDCSANDHCSSSKSNMELSSPALKVHTDDAGECSFGALIAGKAPEDISERDICISILRDQGLLDKVWVRRDGVSYENTNNYCSKSCKLVSGFVARV